MGTKGATTLRGHNSGGQNKSKKMEKPGFKKRSNLGNSIKGKPLKKHRMEEEASLYGMDDSGESSEEYMDSSSKEEVRKVVPKESTAYDELLKTLGSNNLAVANAVRRRQKEEEGQSDSEEDAKEEALGDFIENEDSEEGNDSDSYKSHTSNSDEELSEDVGSDDYELSDTDEESKLRPEDQTLSKASGSMSSTFDKHLSYSLASEETENLQKKRWSYVWKVPALNMSNCYWRGTGNGSIEELDIHSCYGLKPRFYKHWLDIYEASGGREFDQSKQKLFFSICNSYYDIMHHNKKPFYLKGVEEDSSIMDAYLMHSLNHIFRSRDLIAKNERKRAKHQEEGMEGKSVDGDVYLDRGFTRPKVLLLLPLAGIARRVVKRLIELTPSKHKADVENLERFANEFNSGRTDDQDEEMGPEVTKSKSTKPHDFEALLGQDNVNDQFLVGVKFTNRGIKLYGDFYTSDILIASPLGLITKIAEPENNKEKDVDYLSSIEILIVDHADVMLMQNWAHVNTVVEALNKIPSKQHGTNIMRIRPWHLDGQAQFYRQTIILGSHTNPDINATFNHHCLNYKGKVKFECKYKGVLPKIMIPARQIYERFDTPSIVEADDARFKYFCEKVFPKIKDSVQNGVMIFISSYFEFVRVRNYLKSQDASFCLFGEYVKRSDISRVRGEFYRGEKKIMLYTERAHFYYRYKIRGVQNLIIYSLPERKEFYPQIVNLLEQSENMSCTVLFSCLDHLRLERTVGSTAAKRMVDSDKSVFVFA